MGWLKNILNPFSLSSNVPGTPENQLKQGKRAAKKAQKALTDQQDADRVAKYESEVNAGVQANLLRVASRGPRTLGSSALASAAAPAGLGASQSPANAAQVSLTDILNRLRGVAL